MVFIALKRGKAALVDGNPSLQASKAVAVVNYCTLEALNHFGTDGGKCAEEITITYHITIVKHYVIIRKNKIIPTNGMSDKKISPPDHPISCNRFI